MPVTTYFKIGYSGPIVMELQIRLKGAGFDPGPIDGVYGPKTEAAWKAYQAAGLPTTTEESGEVVPAEAWYENKMNIILIGLALGGVAILTLKGLRKRR